MNTHTFRGYGVSHASSESDSDGDGGTNPKLSGLGHIEFSQKGIPHGSLHFPEMLKWAGHIHMHNTCAPEASHRLNIKKAMDRVRKGDDTATSASMIAWWLRVRIWGNIVSKVKHDSASSCPRTTTTRKKPYPKIKVTYNSSKILRPHMEVSNMLWAGTFSPLRAGRDHLASPDARISYYEVRSTICVLVYAHSYMCTHICLLICDTIFICPYMTTHICALALQLATLISTSMGWDIDHVLDTVHVRLYCSAQVKHPSGAKRTYWATESRYPFNRGCRRDMVEIDLGGGKIGVAQLITFIEMDHLPVRRNRARAVLIRWMSASPRQQTRDDHGRPLCDYPLSSNHCLWKWSDSGRNRLCFRRPAFLNTVVRQRMWNHVPETQRTPAINKEIRARYDVIPYNALIRHANVAEDPTTGLMLQTLQML